MEGIGGKEASGHGHLVEEIVQGQIRIPSNREPEVSFENTYVFLKGQIKLE